MSARIITQKGGIRNQKMVGFVGFVERTTERIATDQPTEQGER